MTKTKKHATADTNAHLIAAAPELLEALKYLVEQCTDGAGNDTVGAVHRALRAIKKAEGQ